MKISEAIELYLARDLAPSTVKSYRKDLATFTSAVSPDLPVNEVTVHDINRWIRIMREQDTTYANHPRIESRKGGLSPLTIQKRVKSARVMFNWLVTIGELSSNPFKDVTLRRSSRPTGSSKAATQRELLAILSAAQAMAEHMGRPKPLSIFMFLVDTGCRAGEAAGLTLDRLHLEDRYAWVLGKGDKLRPVFFVDETANALAAWLEVRKEKKSPGDNRVWQMNADPLSQVIGRLSQRAGLDRTVYAHAIRHAVGKAWAQTVSNEQMTQLKLGHDDPSVTIQHYYNTQYDDLRRMSDRLGLLALRGLPETPLFLDARQGTTQEGLRLIK